MSITAVEKCCHYCRKILGDPYFIINDADADGDVDEMGYFMGHHDIECCVECRYKFWEENSKFWVIAEIYDPIEDRFEILDL